MPDVPERGFDFGQPTRDGSAVRIPVTVPGDLSLLEGHFPGNPIVPGVGQIVALAEAQARRNWPELGAPRGLRRVKFQQALRPGDELSLVLERESKGAKVRFSIARGPEECTRGVLVFAED
jgi:3-hydroxymyristoyl/3-hydroxydecanoyl-(acyl carrier protein) dehydratase